MKKKHHIFQLQLLKIGQSATEMVSTNQLMIITKVEEIWNQLSIIQGNITGTLRGKSTLT
jgi:hypothetical protein